MLRALAALVVSFTLLGLRPAAAQDNPAVSVANDFVAGIDTGDLGQLYDRLGGPTFTKSAGRQLFIDSSGMLRVQWGGAAVVRQFIGGEEFRQTPTGQQGDFYYVRYKAKFPSGVVVFEDVYLERPTSDWKVSGFWVSPAPLN